MSSKMIIALDMDGVIADFESYIRDDLQISLPPYSDNSKEAWKIRHKMFGKIDKLGAEFWENLAPMEDMLHLVNFIRENGKFFILTAHPRNNIDQTILGKKRWIKKHLEMDATDDNFICCWRKDKQNHINHMGEPAILIDDNSKNIDAWVDAGGIGILHTCPYETVTILQTLQK